MSFKEDQFPTNVSYGTSGGPGFNTQVTRSDSAFEQRLSRWSTPLRQFSISLKDSDPSEVGIILSFFFAMKGATYGFRFKDWTDYSTASDHQDAGVTYLDEEIGIGDGTTTTFQLIKNYVTGNTTSTRLITKPVDGTTVISVHSVEVSSGVTVDTTTGVVTFDTAPTAGQVVRAGFEFDVPVRFSESTDKSLSYRYNNFDHLSTSIDMVEILDTTPIRHNFDHGGAHYVGSGESQTISTDKGMFWVVNPVSGLIKLTLPNISPQPLGGPVFAIKNDNTASNTIQVLDSDGTTILTNISPTKSALVFAGLDSAGGKEWYTL